MQLKIAVLECVVNNLDQHGLLRACFFSGLILLVGFSILLLILGEAHQDHSPLFKWVVAGIIGSVIPILLSVSIMLGFRISPLKYGTGNYWVGTLLLNSIVITFLVIILASICVVSVVGDSAMEAYIIKNEAILLVVFPESMTLNFLLYKCGRMGGAQHNPLGDDNETR